MSKPDEDEAAREAELNLEESRRLAEERLAEVRAAVGREVGRVPRAATLIAVGVAVAAGLALGLFARRRRLDRRGV